MPERQIQCPNCPALLKVTDSLVGRRIRCPQCQVILVVPEANRPTDPPQPLEAILVPEQPDPVVPKMELPDRERPSDRSDPPWSRRPSEDLPPRRRWGDEDEERRGPARYRSDRDEPTGDKPPAKPRRFFGLLSLVTLLMVVVYGILFGLVKGGGIDVSLPGIDRDPPQHDDRFGRKDRFDDFLVPPIIELQRDAQAELAQAKDRSVRIAALRVGERQLIESLPQSLAWHSQDLALGRLQGVNYSTFGNYPTFSPDGLTLATMHNTKVYLWDLRTGKKLHELAGPATDPDCIAFSANGTEVLAASDTKLWIWDARTGKLARTPEIGYADDRRATFSRDGKTFSSFVENVPGGTVGLWNVANGFHIRNIGRYGGEVPSVAFRPDDKVIATATLPDAGPGRIRLWDIESGRPLRHSFGREADLLAFAPDGQTLAAAQTKGTNVYLFDLESGVEREFPHPAALTWVTFSPDGKLLLTATANSLHLWDAMQERELARQEVVNSFKPTFSPGGSFVVDQSGRLFLVSDLLDAKLGARLAEAKKFAHVSRKGTAFDIRPNVNLRLEDLTRLLQLLPTRVVDLSEIEGVNDSWLAAIKSIGDLRELRLGECKGVTNAGLAHIAGLKKLETLDLSDIAGITDAGLAHCEGMTELTHVWLDGTRVTRAGLARLRKATKMRFLNLNGLPIGDDGLKEIAGMTQLTELYLGNCGISDEGLAHLAGLTQLTNLSLNENEEVKTALNHLKGMTELQFLDLHDTEAADEGLLHLAGLTNLTRLDLRKTKVTDKGLAAVKGMTKLNSLSLPPSATDAGLSHIAGLVELSHLDWGEAKGITGPGLAHLEKLKKINGYDLSKTGVTDEGLAHVKGLTHLTYLTLPKGVGDAGLKHLAPLVSLTSLTLTDTKVTDEGLKQLHNLPFLEYLTLNDTGIGDDGLPHLRKLLKLQYLALDGTKVTDAGIPQVARLTKLRTLSLQRTGITDAGLAHLHSMSKLGTVWLRQTKVTDKGSEDLKKAVPGLSVLK